MPGPADHTARTLLKRLDDERHAAARIFETNVVAVQRTDPLSRQLEHFCAVVRGEATPLVSARDALQTLRVTRAIDESARTGRPVATISP